MIPISKPSITEKEICFVEDAIKSGWVSSLGPYIDKFENKFAEFCNVPYALSVSNATVGLHLALVTCGVGSNDEVIIPDLTFVATANAVRHAGAIPVLVDIKYDSLCIDESKIEESITERTKAIIPVHLYGHPANMEAIIRIAKKHNLFIIEDAAEAHGASIGNKKVGGFGDIGVFSFYGNKIMTTGEGGMLVLNDESLYEKAKMLRDHAMSKTKRYWHETIGYNYRMTNIQAAIGFAQLERIDELMQKRKMIFEWYKNGLSKRTDILLNRTQHGYSNSYWLVCLELINTNRFKRDELIDYLKLNEIDTRPYFFPISSLPMYKTPELKVSVDVSSRGLNLPTYFDLTEDKVEIITKSINKFLGK